LRFKLVALKYKLKPTPDKKEWLLQRFDELFSRSPAIKNWTTASLKRWPKKPHY
jgi:hypothetical protein